MTRHTKGPLDIFGSSPHSTTWCSLGEEGRGGEKEEEEKDEEEEKEVDEKEEDREERRRRRKEEEDEEEEEQVVIKSELVFQASVTREILVECISTFGEEGKA